MLGGFPEGQTPPVAREAAAAGAAEFRSTNLPFKDKGREFSCCYLLGPHPDHTLTLSICPMPGTVLSTLHMYKTHLPLTITS